MLLLSGAASVSGDTLQIIDVCPATVFEIGLQGLLISTDKLTFGITVHAQLT